MRVEQLEMHADFMGMKQSRLIEKRQHILAKIDAAWKSLGTKTRKLAVPLLAPEEPSWLCENQLGPLERQLRQLKQNARLGDS